LKVEAYGQGPTTCWVKYDPLTTCGIQGYRLCSRICSSESTGVGLRGDLSIAMVLSWLARISAAREPTSLLLGP